MIIVMIMPFTFARSHCNIIERKIVSGKWRMFASVCFYCWFASTTTTNGYQLLLCLFVLALGDLATWRMRVYSYYLWCQHFDGNVFVCIFIECFFRSIFGDAYQHCVIEFIDSTWRCWLKWPLKCHAIPEFIIYILMRQFCVCDAHLSRKNRRFNLI